MEPKTFTIPEHNMGELETKIEALNKKARKIGVPEIKIVVVGSFNRTFNKHPITGYVFVVPVVVKYNEVIIEGEAPKFAGWSFLGRVDHEETGNIICAVPGIELNKKYRTAEPICDHCHIKRFRKSSFVVRHEDGTEKQVGSACLKDFLGHRDPERIANFCQSFFTLIREMGEEDEYSEFRSGGHYRYYDTLGVLTLTVGIIRTYGWISTQKAYDFGGESTAMTVSRFLNSVKDANEIKKEMGEITKEEEDFAKLALEWIRNRKELPSDKGDYFYNLKTLCANESVDQKRFGIVCSLIPTYRREVEHIFERAAKTTEVSSWIGHPDLGRMTLKNVKIVGYNAYENHFGTTTHLYRFLANGKDKLSWFASKNQGFGQGDVVNITFSVKKLDEYKGEHITVITRAKMVKSDV